MAEKTPAGITIFRPGRHAVSRLVKPSPISTMTEDRHLTHWLRALRSAERELDEARLRSDLNRAARRLMDAKHELKRLRGGLAAVSARRGYNRIKIPAYFAPDMIRI